MAKRSRLLYEALWSWTRKAALSHPAQLIARPANASPQPGKSFYKSKELGGRSKELQKLGDRSKELPVFIIPIFT